MIKTCFNAQTFSFRWKIQLFRMTHFLRDSNRITYILFLITGAEKRAWFIYEFALYVGHPSLIMQ